MFECKICERKFDTVTALVSHLNHPRSACKTNIQEYYNKYYRKSDEGKCLSCGNDLMFTGLVHGYYKASYCKKCKNLNPETQRKRKVSIDKKRLIKENKRILKEQNLPFSCKLCNRKFKSLQGLSKHISQIHKDYSIQQYYDKFIKQPGEGICSITNKPTRFKSIIDGYFQYDGIGTCSADDKIKEKKEQTLMKNYGVKNPVLVNTEQRIKKFKKHFKKNRELKEKRLEVIGVLRKLTINKKDKKQCQLCGKKFNSIISTSTHIHKAHCITIQYYYDKFFKKEKEGICPISGLEVTFNSLEYGYYKYHITSIVYSEEIKKGCKKAQLQYIKKKIKEEQSKYNVEFIDLDIIDTIGEKTKIKCLKCNKIYENRLTNLRNGYGKCPSCFPRNTHISKAEQEIAEYIMSLTNPGFIKCSNYGIIQNPKNGRSLELDIYIPSKKIAIEFNGLYWHSEVIVDKNYHLMKTTECKKKGIQLIHIFEDEWNNKKEIVKRMLKHKLGLSKKKIYARKCIIKEIEPKVKNEFLNEFHIQGKDVSRIKLGAFYKDELVAVMTFGLGNISKGGDPNNKLAWELNRFASSCHVIGIGGKLLKHFQRNYEWEKIYSYADLRWSGGNVYKQLGFKLKHQTLPNYFYVDGMRRIHRFNLRKRPDEPKNIPEWKLRYDEGYIRIWDCGNLKFELTKKENLL